MIRYNTKERKELIKRFGLSPDFEIKIVSVLNIPASFCGYDSKRREMWRSPDGKTLYLMK